MTIKSEISKELSYRLKIINVIMIILVIFIHSYRTEIKYEGEIIGLVVPKFLEILKRIISRRISISAVPLFFLISSFLLFSKEIDFRKNLVKKSKTLLIPYLFWNTFWIILYFIAQNISFTKSFFSNPNTIIRNFGTRDFLYAYIGNLSAGSSEPFLFTLWFIRDLMILNIFCLLIKKIIDKYALFVLVGSFCFWFFDINFYIVTATSLLFFVLGYFIVKYNLQIEMIDNIKYRYRIPVYIFAVAFSMLNHPVISNIFYKATVIIGICFFIKLSRNIYLNNKFREFFLKLSSFTFFIYCFHEYNNSIAIKAIGKIFPETALIQTLEYLLLPFIIMSFCIIIALVLQKFTPKFFSIITGNRIK